MACDFVWPKVLGPGGARNYFYFVEQKLTPTRKCSVTPIDIHVPIALGLSSHTSHCSSQGSQMGKTEDWLFPLETRIAPFSLAGMAGFWLRERTVS